MEVKIKGEAPEQNRRKFPIEEIISAIKTPFFSETASVGQGEATGTYIIKGTESFLQGHFKDRPVFPASIMIEAFGQLAAFIYLLPTMIDSSKT